MRLLQLPLSFFSVRTVGDITKRLDELTNIRGIVLQHALEVMTVVIGGLVNIVIIGLYSPKVLGVLLGMLVLPAVFVAVVSPGLMTRLRTVYKAEEEWQTRSWEHIAGLTSIKSLGAEIAARWRWTVDLFRALRLRRRLGMYEAGAGVASDLLTEAVRITVLLASVYFYSKDELTAGHVLAIALLSGVVIDAAMTAIDSWHSFNELGVSIARVDDVVTASPESRAAEPTGEMVELSGAVEMKGVGFQYGSELSPLILDGISLRIEPNETVALVGRSGSGKTTLGYMFNLLYAPTEGEIRFDGRAATDIPLAHLRRQIGMIVQDNSIFSGTLIDNIALGDPHPSFKDVVAAAEAADAHEFIVGLPNGYSTTLGESGEGLSGGQKQRINIARALYRSRAILVMDEATSALDAISEAKIVKNLKHRRGTTIVIAHRLNTVMHADRIVVLEHGRVVETGTHESLLAKRGQYHQLFAKQLTL